MTQGMRPGPGEAFTAAGQNGETEIHKIFRVDDATKNGEFVVIESTNRRWLIREMESWKAGPRFEAVRELNP